MSPEADHGSTGAIAAAFVANMGIAIAKFAGFVITGSSALLAESIHSLADSSNQALLFLGGRRASRPPTPLHPFGYGRARYFWSFVVALVLFSLGGLFSIYEGYQKLIHPHEITSPLVAFGILAVAIVFECFALATAVRHAKPERRERGWIEFIRSSRSPELPVLLMEDTAALLGLIFATAGIALALVTGNPLFDACGTLAIGVLLVAVAIVLAIEMKSLLMGEAAAPDVIERIETQIQQGDDVRKVIHLITQHLGPEEVLVAAKVEFDSSLSMEALARAINACEERVRSSVPIARVIYVEPDLYARRSAPAPSHER
jgi:cation diffusion facilitator family transporter